VNGAGVQILNSTVRNITITNNFIHDFDCPDDGAEQDAGVYSNRGGSGQRITNNRIIRRANGPHTGGNSNCILIRSDSGSPSGGGHYIGGNYLQGCYDGIGTQSEDDEHGGLDGNSVVENNTVYDIYDDCIQIEGGTHGVIVRNNHMERCAVGIANAPNFGDITFEGNTILNGVSGNTSPKCFKIGDAAQGADGRATYRNNRCYLPSGGADGWAQTNSGMNPITSRGNQIHVSRYVIEFLTDPNQFGPMDFDQDCFYTTDSGRFIKWGSSSQTYGSMSSFRNATGQEPNGTQSSTCGH
jgi:hypothetical protein